MDLNRKKLLEEWGMVNNERKIIVEGGEFLEKSNNNSLELFDCNGKTILKDYIFRSAYDKYLYVIKQNRLYVFYYSMNRLQEKCRILIKKGNLLLNLEYVAIVAYEDNNKILAVFDHKLEKGIYDENGLKIYEKDCIIHVKNSSGKEIRFLKNSSNS